MLEVLEFIFSSFWIWLGCVVLVASFGQAIGAVIGALKS